MAVEVATLKFRADTSELDALERRLKKIGAAANDAEGGLNNNRKATDKLGASASRMGLAIGVAAVAMATFATIKLVSIQRQFDIINSSLITVTGSTENAALAFAQIKEFAATTPYDLGQVADAFVKLKAFGLDPSEEALRSYGNTASAMGKDLGQMVQAVANATTGEFEMLKTFGIKAKTETDSISFTFRGLTTSVGKNSAEIQAYLLNLGKTDFAGAMETRAATLDGAISNLGDSFDQLFLTISQAGVGGAMETGVRVITSAIDDINFSIASMFGLLTDLQKTSNIEEQIASLFQTIESESSLAAAGIKINVAEIRENIRTLQGELAAVGGNQGGVDSLRQEQLAVRNRVTAPAAAQPATAAETKAMEEELEARIDAEEILMKERWDRQLAADEAGADAAQAAMEERWAVAVAGELMLKQTQMENMLAIAQAGLDMENAAFKQAEDDKIRMSQNTTDSMMALGEKLLEGKSKNAQAALHIGMNLANAEKRENAKQIISDSYGAAMKAYKALAGIPYIGPFLGAAAAGTIIAAGATYAGQSLAGRALGGQVLGGESYMVGERGPEVLTMGSMSGNITPNSAITNNSNSNTSNKTANVSFTIVANDTAGFDELLASRRGHIISLINSALNDQGREAIA
tara:strand:+ start:10495 stop:12405 length:1911 start_codon:yes stop_codon:yes gene_type:complete